MHNALSTSHVAPYIPPSFTRLCQHYKTEQYDSSLHHIKVLLNPSNGEANTSVITRTKTDTQYLQNSQSSTSTKYSKIEVSLDLIW